MPRTLADIERDLRRGSIVIRLADSAFDAARVVRMREQQDLWLEEWATVRQDER